MFKVIVFVLLFVFIAPLLTAVHELGHAIMPLLKAEPVSITVGEGPSVEYKNKNLEIKIGLLKPWVGYTKWKSEDSVLTALLGPVFSLLLAVILLFITRFFPPVESFLYACAGWCLFQFFMTIFPMHYPSWLGYKDQSSDGVKIMNLLKK